MAGSRVSYYHGIAQESVEAHLNWLIYEEGLVMLKEEAGGIFSTGVPSPNFIITLP